MELTIQEFGPRSRRSALTLRTVTVRLRAPDEWLPWLRAAREGDGLLGRRICDWATRLPPPQASKVRRRLDAASPAERRRIIEDEVARHFGGYRTAVDLLREYFAWSTKPDLETQWAWSDLILYDGILGRVLECRETARTMYEARLAPRVAKAVVCNVAGCIQDARWNQEHMACLKESDPAACSKALLGRH